MFLIIFLAFLCQTSGEPESFLLSRKVCYGELGCFSTDSPFRSLQRPIVLLPDSPEAVNTTFWLHTRLNVHSPTQLSMEVPKPAEFSPSHKTVFLVHGFIQSMNRPWVKVLTQELLRKEDINVIVVNWANGAGLPYTQASGNARLVGVQIERLCNYMRTNYNASYTRMHIVGHNLGAHIAGYAGERMPRLARITGLDPAEPYFQNTDAQVHLDKTDADFVDVIHTDGSSIIGLGFGASQPMGDVDFYPNSGENQPGCPGTSLKILQSLFNVATLDLEEAEALMSCSHMSAINYFIESISSVCPFTAFHCDSWESFKDGTCDYFGGPKNARMGYYADELAGKIFGSYYLHTGEYVPYCKYHYFTSITASRRMKEATKGTLQIALRGKRGFSKFVPFHPDEKWAALEKKSGMIAVKEDLVHSDLIDLKFIYEKEDGFLTDWIYPDFLEIEKVEIDASGKKGLKICEDITLVEKEFINSFGDKNKCPK